MSEVRALIGIDGGGSKTRCLVADDAGRILGEGFAGPSNYQTVGRQAAEAALRTAVQGALLGANLALADVVAACAGLAGAARPEDRSVMVEALAFLKPARIQLTDDAHIALEGALAGVPGVVVISGTGSIALGKNAAGETFRAGGWGWVLGDEGSGFDIGRRALAAALAAQDGTGPATSLGERICRAWRLERLDQVIRRVYGNPAESRPVIAGLVPLVVQAAGERDTVAAAILIRGGRKLGQLAAAVLDRLALPPGTPRLIAVSGGVITGVSAVRQAMTAAVAERYADAAIMDSRRSPAEGALALAAALLQDDSAQHFREVSPVERPEQQPSAPLYYQIRRHLLDAIESGVLQPGDRAPSERELTERFGVTRPTVRQALMELENRGLLQRIQGKGTFVASPKLEQPPGALTSFTEDMHRRGMEPGALVLSVGEAPAGQRVAEVLGLEPGAPVFRLERLRLAGGVPMAHEVSHIDARLCPGLDNIQLEHQSLYRTLQENYGLSIRRATQSLEAVAAGPYEATVLQVREGAPLMLLERISRTADDRKIEYVRSHYRGDRYRFLTELERQEEQPYAPGPR